MDIKQKLNSIYHNRIKPEDLEKMELGQAQIDAIESEYARMYPEKVQELKNEAFEEIGKKC